jgi:hypothetical protein
MPHISLSLRTTMLSLRVVPALVSNSSVPLQSRATVTDPL